MKPSIVKGRATTLGESTMQVSRHGVAGYTTYTYILFEDENGGRVRAEKIIVGPNVGLILEPGIEGTFVIHKTGTLFAQKILYAIKSGEEDASEFEFDGKYYGSQFAQYLMGLLLGVVLCIVLIGFLMVPWALYEMITLPIRAGNTKKAVEDLGISPPPTVRI